MIWIIFYLIVSYPLLVLIIKFGNWVTGCPIAKEEIGYTFWFAPISLPILIITTLILFVCFMRLFIMQINDRITDYLSK